MAGSWHWGLGSVWWIMKNTSHTSLRWLIAFAMSSKTSQEDTLDDQRVSPGSS